MNFPNNQQERYLNELNKVSNLKFCIIGQDIYPENASGIAFCKSDFTQLLQYNCSGKYVLNALGYDSNYIHKLIEEKKKTEDFFIELLHTGICFLNISYELLNNIPKDNLDIILGEYKTYNEFFLNKSNKIVLLGKTKTHKLFKEYYQEYNEYEVLIHPSIRNQNKDEWKKIYNNKYFSL